VVVAGVGVDADDGSDRPHAWALVSSVATATMRPSTRQSKGSLRPPQVASRVTTDPGYLS
jgi:hypothetical protein